MKLFILQYAKQEDVDAEDDCPSDVDLETMSSPQFACVCTLDHLDAAIAQVMKNVEGELAELDYEVNDLEWVYGEWVDPVFSGARRNKTICLLDHDDDLVAQIVIQEVEAFTG